MVHIGTRSVALASADVLVCLMASSFDSAKTTKAP